VPRTLGQALGFLLGFAVALWLSPLAVRASGSEPGSDFGELEAALFRGVNEVRSQHHLIVLTRRADLDDVARAYSADMAARHYFSHESPEGGNAVTRLQGHGVEGFTLAAENLGVTNRADPTQEILSHWLQSPAHRRNLLAPPFNATGIGVAMAPDGSLYYTQVYVTFPR
jgi:uncharacterized protein YkwD